MDKLPEDISAQIWALPCEWGVEVEPKYHTVAAITLPPPAIEKIQVDVAEHGQL